IARLEHHRDLRQVLVEMLDEELFEVLRGAAEHLYGVRIGALLPRVGPASDPRGASPAPQGAWRAGCEGELQDRHGPRRARLPLQSSGASVRREGREWLTLQ